MKGSCLLYDSGCADFYDIQAKSPNPIRRWWHRARRELIYKTVGDNYDGGLLADFGCGNCTWNYRGDYNVVGVDKNQDTLVYALKRNRLAYIQCADITHTLLIGGSIGMVVSSEVMEHIPDTPAYLGEIHRVLRPGGRFILTVPCDTTVSFWRPLFAIQCYIKGQLFKDPYYIGACGHIHHFSKRKLQTILEQNGFRVIRLTVHWGMTLCCVAQKEKR
jgi:SAM-dependent methyltransferase